MSGDQLMTRFFFAVNVHVKKLERSLCSSSREIIVIVLSELNEAERKKITMQE